MFRVAQDDSVRLIADAEGHDDVESFIKVGPWIRGPRSGRQTSELPGG
jgi:hypothetical protein